MLTVIYDTALEEGWREGYWRWAKEAGVKLEDDEAKEEDEKCDHGVSYNEECAECDKELGMPELPDDDVSEPKIRDAVEILREPDGTVKLRSRPQPQQPQPEKKESGN